MICGAAPLSADLINQIAGVLPNAQIGQGYGRHRSLLLVMSIPDEA